MATIDQGRFVSQLTEYAEHHSEDTPELIDAALTNRFGSGNLVEGTRGINFDYTAPLLSDLLLQAYSELPNTPKFVEYAHEVAAALEDFAQGFSEHSGGVMCYPHFLLHGLHSDNATGVASIIRRNGRIIHETRAAREQIEEQIFPRQLNDEYRLSRESTISDDYWGISAAIKSKELGDEYITKAGFFLDMSARELYIIHVQGRKPVTGDGDRKYYHEAAGKLQMSPRVAVLRETLRIAEEIEFKKVRMIKAYEHPFALEEHRGYQANHDRDARKAGLCEETDVYLEKTLVS